MNVRPAGNPISRVHRFLFIRHGRLSVAVSVAAYAAVVLTHGEDLAISNNYFVILPIIVAALWGGMPAGLVAGLLGLPANLALFALIGHPEFSPASKPIAETFGILVGFFLGYLSDYFRELEEEIRKRALTEESLRTALEEKGLLLEELHHRVKNNLNVIKGLVRLQRSRSTDPAFIEAADELINRILAISQMHDLLCRSESPLVEPRPYLESIAANVASTFASGRAAISVSVEAGLGLLPSETAIPLGLVVNEALTNALKHARASARACSVSLSLAAMGEKFVLAIRDDGTGLGDGPDEARAVGLGTKLVRALAAQLGGTTALSTVAGPDGAPVGALFEMRWPRG